MAEVFRLCGAVASRGGARLANVRLAVVDEDPFSDDLLGVGVTDANGEFRLSFTREEFNQDWLESEEVPDIYLVFSVRDDAGRLRVTDQVMFPGLRFEGGCEDLGVVEIDHIARAPDFLDALDPTPGMHKRVKRLRLSEGLLEHCFEDVAPLVESLTGWGGLLEGLRVEVVRDLTPRHDPELDALLGGGAGSGGGWLARRAARALRPEGAFLALYAPHTHTVSIDATLGAQQNLDALKVALGHELVHVGQRLHADHLYQARRRALRGFVRAVLARGEGGEGASAEAEAAVRAAMGRFQDAMAELEGYAWYIQRDFLEPHYNLATFFHHPSVWDRLARVVSRLGQQQGSGSEDGEARSAKADQYAEGCRRFRARARGGEPFRYGGASEG